MHNPSFIVLFFFLTVQVSGQQLPDSIAHRFGNVPVDSNLIIRLNSLGTHYLKTNPTLSRQIASYSSDRATKIKYTRGYARALTLIGNSYWYEGVYEFAQNYYLLAARQYRHIGDSIGLGQVYNNIGEVNKRLGEYETALQYLVHALNLKKNDSTRGLTLYNIGELYLALQRYDEAKSYIDQSLAIAFGKNDERVIAYDYWTLGRLKMAQGDLQESLHYYEKAIALWLKLGEVRSLIQTYQDLSENYRKREDYTRATYYLDESLAMAFKINVPDLRIKTYLGYSKIDSARGNYIRALYYLSKHNALKDSIYNLLKAEQIARIQTIYETEIRERENQQLRSEKKLSDQQLRSREWLLAVISLGLLITGILAWISFKQRSEILAANKKLREKNEEIHQQKEAIEVQAEAMIRLNEALKELNGSLENRIEERSRQLLLQNQKLSEYTFINAHKLRAPVASILGLLNLIPKVNEQERADILKHLQTCGDQLDEIITEISKSLEAAIVSEERV
jgi:tetratricopeptide (TPR) repeat protein